VSPLTAADIREARKIVERHRRHVELSPGVGASEQAYGLAVCDDILTDLQMLSSVPQGTAGEPRAEAMEMRERAARVADKVADGGKPAHFFDVIVAKRIAAEIRSLPLTEKEG
jgi:hypothetical protein